MTRSRFVFQAVVVVMVCAVLPFALLWDWLKGPVHD